MILDPFHGNSLGLGQPFFTVFYHCLLYSGFYNFPGNVVGTIHIKTLFIKSEPDGQGSLAHDDEMGIHQQS